MTVPRRRAGVAAQAALCIGAAALVALASHFLGVTLCPLKRLAGVPCPTCGTTRACLALLKGDVRGALAMQPFALAALCAAGAWAAFPRVRAAAAALWAKPAGKALAAALVAADWAYVLWRGN